MANKELNKRAAGIEREIRALLIALKPDIADDYRAYEDDDSGIPSMQITIAVDAECTEWSYQTGDNSFTGGCYSLPYWGVSALYRRSNCAELARELLGQALEQIETKEA